MTKDVISVHPEDAVINAAYGRVGGACAEDRELIVIHTRVCFFITPTYDILKIVIKRFNFSL